jgi:hypothetical protein
MYRACARLRPLLALFAVWLVGPGGFCFTSYELYTKCTVNRLIASSIQDHQLYSTKFSNKHTTVSTSRLLDCCGFTTNPPHTSRSLRRAKLEGKPLGHPQPRPLGKLGIRDTTLDSQQNLKIPLGSYLRIWIGSKKRPLPRLKSR